MSQLFDLTRRSLPSPALLALEGIEESPEGIVLRVRGRRRPRCPTCGTARISHHSSYRRRLRDLPWLGLQVVVELHTRRFRCRSGSCPRLTFSEQIPAVAGAWARETVRSAQMLLRCGYALGGRPARQLLLTLGMATSADTVLRRVKARPQPAVPRVRVLGVDDWAWRKHHRYGTMLMDLETGRVVDLLPIRTAASFEAWLREHPGVEVITRDRSVLFADGGRRGACTAAQIHDRFHLVSNLYEAAQSDVHHVQVEAKVDFAADPPVIRRKPIGRRRLHRRVSRDSRREQYAAVVELARQGETTSEIARRRRLSEKTVSRWLRAPAFPERRLKASYAFSRAFSANRMGALLANPEALLSPTEQQQRAEFLQLYPGARTLHVLLLRFRALLRWRNPKLLEPWIAAALAAPFPFTRRFAQLLEQDLAAVKLSISAAWSNGPLEGQINRLKVIKRQMYGRAGFDLLKARVLPLDLEVAA